MEMKEIKTLWTTEEVKSLIKEYEPLNLVARSELYHRYMMKIQRDILNDSNDMNVQINKRTICREAMKRHYAAIVYLELKRAAKEITDSMNKEILEQL